MIRRLYVDNDKCLINFELVLEELTLLVGLNGVGRSSVMDAIFALRQLLSGAVVYGQSREFGLCGVWHIRARPDCAGTEVL